MADDLQAIFNEIAPSWYNFRHHTIFRAELEKLAREWAGGRLLNLGCGHGADFLPFAGKFDLYGIDFAEEMITLARKYATKYHFQPALAVADLTALPFPDAAFDCAIAVATYHHLKEPSRLPALKELRRVLKPGGSAFITVWNRGQPKFWLKNPELLIPWKRREGTLYRYYHLFTYGEIGRLARAAGFTVTAVFPESGYRLPVKNFSRNICLTLKKA